MSWGMVAGAVIGGVVSSSASKSASKDQVNASKDATEAERQAMERQIELQEPWRQAGGLGLNRLAFELGLSPTGTFTPGSTGGAGGVGGGYASGIETEQQIRDRLTPKYVTDFTPETPFQQTGAAGGEATGGILAGQQAPETVQQRINEAALNAAVQAERRKQEKAFAEKNALAATAAQKDPAYGNLLRDFSMADFQVDPGYSFRSDEGLKALERSAAARGGLMSGRAMKDTMRFSQGLASQEYGAAFDRFNVNKTNRYNRLASISGVGQTAANQTGAAVGAFGQSAANNAIGAGNAAAAGRVGAANAWSGAIGQGISAYQNNQLMNRFFPQGGGGGGGYGAPPNPYFSG